MNIRFGMAKTFLVMPRGLTRQENKSSKVHLSETSLKATAINFNSIVKNCTKEQIKQFIEKLNPEQVVELTTYLFYCHDGVNPPVLYNMLFQDDPLIQGVNSLAATNKYDKLLTICGTLENRLKDLRIDKLNTILSNQIGFEQIFSLTISKIKDFIVKQRDLALLQGPQKLKQLKLKISNLAKDIDLYNKVIKGGGAFKPTNSSLVMLSNAVSDACGDMPTDVEKSNVTGNLEIDMSAKLIAFVSWAIGNNLSITIGLAQRQAIGFHKRYCLEVLRNYYALGGELTSAELNHFRKFLSIKRGDKLNNLFTRTTQSAKQLDEIISSHNNDDRASLESAISEDAATVGTAANLASKTSLEGDWLNFIEVKTKFKSLILQQDYKKLNKYLKKIINQGATDLLFTIVFKVKNFRGTLLSHLLQAPSGIIDNDLDEALKLVIDKVKEAERIKERIKDISDKKSHDEIMIYLTRLPAITNKYEFLIDFQHIILGVYLNPNLNDSQKKDIIFWLTNELNKKSEGKFAAIRVKRSQTGNKLALGAIAFQSLNTSYVGTIIAKNNIATNDIFSGLAAASLSVLPTLLEKVSTSSNTTTLFSARQIISFQAVTRLEKRIPMPTMKNADKQPTGNEEVALQFKEDGSNYLFKNTLKQLERYLLKGEGSSNDILNTLTEIGPGLSYAVLTSNFKDDFILNKLFQVLKEKELSNLMQLWKKCVSLHLDIKVDSSMPMLEFRRYVAKEQFATANKALIHYYHILALIALEEIEENKKSQLSYFAAMIYRAKDDPTSVWYALRKRDKGQEQLLRSLINVTTAVLYGGVTASLLATGIGATLLVPLIFLLSALRGLVSAATNNLSHTNTYQYKQAEQILADYFPKIELNNKQQTELHELMKKLKGLHSKVYEPLHQLVAAGDNGKFKSEWLQDQLTYFNIADDDIKNEDEDNIKKINECCTNLKEIDLNQVYLELNTLIEQLSQEADGKYLATKALFRLVRIIKLSNLPPSLKLEVLIKLTVQFSQRNLKIAALISQERSFLTKNNYLIGNLASSVTTTITTFLTGGLSAVPLFSTGLLGGVSDVIGGLISQALLPTNANNNNTKTYQESMSFLKYVLIDALQEHNFAIKEILNKQQLTLAEQEQLLVYNKLKEMVEFIINMHTGRRFTRVGQTTSSKTLKQLSQQDHYTDQVVALV